MRIIDDPEFSSALGRGMLFAVLSSSLGLLSGLGLAHLMYRGFRGLNTFRVILCLPLAIPPIAIGSMWKLLVSPSIGPVSYYMGKIGIAYDITMNAQQAFATTLLIDLWHWLPFSSLVLLSGLVAIPRDILEAADIDGASGWHKWRKVILPMIVSQCLIVILIRFMDSFRIFDEVYMLTAGGPGSATRYLSLYLYNLILRSWDIGYGLALSTVFFFIVEWTCFALFRVIGKR